MRVVVTGGAGFIGSHLIDALMADRDTSVVAVDNLRRGRLLNVAHHDGDPRFQLLAGDVRDEAFLQGALTGAQVVYHLAAQSNVLGAINDPRYSFEANVAGTFNVLEASRRAGVRRLVFASSRETYGETETLPVHEDTPLRAKNTYGASKVAAEAYCRTFQHVFGLETAILRFANVYGPRDIDRVIPLWIEHARRGEPIEVFGGRQVIDFIPVETVVQALLRAATAHVAGTPINVASGRGTAINDLALSVREAVGSASPIVMRPARHSEVVRFVADTGRMRELLGITPPTDPLERLDALVNVSRVEMVRRA